MAERVELPPQQPPVLTRVVSDRLLPEADGSLLMWAVGSEHPFIPGMIVLRMYLLDSGAVDAYAVTSDGTSAARYRIPESRIRVCEESMPINVLVEELEVAENGDEDEDDENDVDENEDVEDHASPIEAAVRVNGSAASDPNGTQT